MTAVPSQKDLWSRIERLERQVGNLQRQSTLSSASISGGNLTIRRGGSLRVIDGGSIVGEGGGNLNWDGPASFGGNTAIGGNLDITGTTLIGGDTSVTGSLSTRGDTTLGGELDINGTTHIGGDLTIDGDTTLGGNLEFAPGAIPPEALATRTEATTHTYSETVNSSNSYSVSTSVSVPSWAASASCIAVSSVFGELTGDATRIGARTSIDGDVGEFTYGISYVSQLSIPSVHGRDFSPSGSFTVEVSGGATPTASTPNWEVSIVVTTVFTN